ncbi:TPA: HTH domain-containing protein [Bacillus mobilis]|uniref:HTH domain-containing protein n=1 Tax=Bacillus mobilis TaxID=2026190 RepID=UPI0011A9FB78|nr:HTH domain-containing protein [Bacillus mobilis]MED4384704.1 HTH domain-containing protein [Bacillus mobilis]
MKQQQIQQLLSFLLTQHDWTTVQKISEELQCSKRSVSNYLTLLKNTYGENIILSSRGKGIKINHLNLKEGKQSIQNKQDLYFFQILQLILNYPNGLTVAKIASTLNVSESYCQSLLQTLRLQFSECDVTLTKQPIRLEGDELRIRKLICHYAYLTTQYSNGLQLLFHEQDISITKYTIQLIERNTGTLSDIGYKRIHCLLLTCIIRYRHKQFIASLEHDFSFLLKNPYAESISSLIEQIENLTGNKLLFPEIIYLHCCVISALHFEHQFPLNTTKFDKFIPIILEELSQHFVFTCSQEKIVLDLKWLVFRFYIFRRLNIHIYHPQLQDLKPKIFYYYTITRKIVNRLIYGKDAQISEHILNYLATYLFSISEPKKKSLPKKMLLLCTTGGGLDLYAKKKLTALSPYYSVTSINTLREVSSLLTEQKQNFDCIISIGVCPSNIDCDIPIISFPIDIDEQDFSIIPKALENA